MADNEKIDDIDKFTDTEKKKKDISGDTKKKKTAYVEVEPTIDEAVGGTVVISFGRMNPVTVGHEKLVNKVIATAIKAKGTPAVYLSHSEDKNKNPLSYEDKIHYATKAFGSVIKKSNAKTIIEVAKSLQKFDNLIVVVGSDRLKEFDTLLNKYNGKDYKFKTIQAVSAGGRDPDSDGVKGMSASKMRELAANEDLAGFTKGLPKKLKSSASDMMDDVRRGMKMAEEKDELVEVLNRAQRRKRALAMRKARVKIKLGQDRARRKKASTDVLKKRAKKRALGVLKQKFAKHKRYADLEPGEKERIEKKIARVDKSRIEKIAKRMLIQVKKDERERFSNMATDNPVTPKRESVTENRRMQLINKIKNSGVVKSGSMSKDSGKNQDKDIGHMKGAQPAAYYAKDADGDKMSVSTKKARAAHFKAKKSGPAPGDANAKTKESKHTKKARAMGFTNESTDLNEMWGQRVSKRPHMLMDKNNKVKFDKRFKMFKPKQIQEANEFNIEDIVDLMESTESYITEKASKSIADKAKKSGMPKGVLQQVYNRGVAAWKTGHRPGTTPEQWGHARVNSFITKSSGTWGKADKDLAAKVRKEETDMNELDRSTLSSYIKKAVHDVADNKKAEQRVKGAVRAKIKINKKDSEAVYGKAEDYDPYAKSAKREIQKSRANAKVSAARNAALNITRKTKSQYQMSKESVNDRFEAFISLSEAATPQMKKAAASIEAYAKKHGGIDKADFMKAAKMLSSGNAGIKFVKFVDDLDTDPREWLITNLAKTMGKQTVEKMFKVKIREEVEESFLDEDITHQTVKPPSHTKKYSGKDSRDTNSIGGGGNKRHTVTSSQADAHDKTAAHHNEVADAHTKAKEKSSSPTLQRLHHQASVHHKKAAEAHFNASHSSSGADKDGSIQKKAKDLHMAYHLTMHANKMSQEVRNKGSKAKRMNEEVELDEVRRGASTMNRLKDIQNKSNAMAAKPKNTKAERERRLAQNMKKLKDMRKSDKSWGKSSAFDYHEEVELDETLSPSEKKLVNQMYDKKGNLTAIGKKVMNHGKKPGDKGYVENTNESVELDEKVNAKAIQKAVDDGKSMDVIMTMFANKRTTNTDEIRKVVKDYMWKKRMKKEEASCGGGAGEEGTDKLVKKYKKDTPKG
jgi:hypothetical protein